MQRRKIKVPWVGAGLADHENSARGIVCNRIDNADLPVLDPAIDNFETGRDAFSRSDYIGGGHAGAVEAILQDEGNLGLGARRDQGLGIDIDIAGDVHPVSQEPEIGLVDPKHVLHGLGSDPDLLADHPLTILAAPGQEIQRDGIGIIDRQRGIARNQRRNRPPFAQAIKKLCAVFLGQCHFAKPVT